MNVKTDLINALKAGYSYFYIKTNEINRAVNDLQDIIIGYENGAGGNPYEVKIWDYAENPDPQDCLTTLSGSDPGTVLIAKNFNWFLVDEYKAINKEFVSILQNNLELFSSTAYRKVLIIVSSTNFEKAIPDELVKDFFKLDFSLPDKEEIKKIYDYIIDSAKESSKFKMPTKEEEKLIIDSSRGMTRQEIQNALSFSIIKDSGKLKATTVARIRAKDIEKTAGLKIGEYKETFESLKGYDNLKDFCSATIKSPLSKGIMLLGPPGVGKTHFCRCLGNETGLPVFELEMAELFGSLVGESEKMMGTALEVISVNAPCILFIDEIEKGLSGTSNRMSGDGGTTQRSTSQLLKFLSDGRPEGVYVVATCNNISSLPPEWVRAGRWDTAPFFVDLPNEEEQEAILDHYTTIYKTNGMPKKMEGWSGAEIESACRIAAMTEKSLGQVEKFVVPVSKTMEREISELRKWAVNRTIPATTVIKGLEKPKKATKRGIEI